MTRLGSKSKKKKSARHKREVNLKFKPFYIMKIDDIHSLFSKSSGISTDTRTIKKNNIFFCLKGEKFDGNYLLIKHLT